MAKLQDYQQRVIDEQAALADKMAKLNNFILGIGNPAFKTLDVDEQWDLRAQLEAMWQYYDVLERRIYRAQKQLDDDHLAND